MSTFMCLSAANRMTVFCGLFVVHARVAGGEEGACV